MNHIRRIIFTVLLCFILSGCLVAPPHESLQRNCGPYPDNYESIIENYLKHDLKDPESLKDFEVIKTPEIKVLDTRYPSIRLHRGYDVWEFFVVYNTTNGDGDNIGRDLHVAWIRHNRLVALDYKGLSLTYRVNERINNTGY